MKITATQNSTRKLTYSALCLALCLVLPLLTGQVPQIGNMLCPMHLPVLVAGFLCGPVWAGVMGFIAPLLRYMIFGMPPIFPTGLSMALELACYGFVSGLLYKKLPKTMVNVYVSLLAAMLAGRVVWGVARVLFSFAADASFTWKMFFAGAVTTAIPGIILQIVLVPLLVLALQKAKIIKT